VVRIARLVRRRGEIVVRVRIVLMRLSSSVVRLGRIALLDRPAKRLVRLVITVPQHLLKCNVPIMVSFVLLDLFRVNYVLLARIVPTPLLRLLVLLDLGSDSTMQSIALRVLSRPNCVLLDISVPALVLLLRVRLEMVVVNTVPSAVGPPVCVPLVRIVAIARFNCLAQLLISAQPERLIPLIVLCLEVIVLLPHLMKRHAQWVTIARTPQRPFFVCLDRIARPTRVLNSIAQLDTTALHLLMY
jgi:hypothetical protein